ncbi:MAG: TerC/Alx family metal homeostasis membrane protein [Myxococcales bacterium]|nr:TerC/Alx family metal homeostasis membrane protein [Myxococcales bacterium]
MDRIEVSPAGWLAFGLTVVALFAVDLFAHRGGRGLSSKNAIAWSVAWVVLGVAFTGFVWAAYGGQAGQEYLGAYLIEKSLSLDNLFVFLVIFRGLRVPHERQRRVLQWGIFGAVVFRGLFIFAGVEAIERWQAITYAFGALLLIVAVRVAREHPLEQQQSKLVEWLKRHFRITHEFRGSKFIIDHDGRRHASPLLVALLAIEVTDIAFAVDSVPAAFSISLNPFVVYSSNIFAILGLRALYAALSRTISELRYLHFGLAAVLVFAGLKMLAARWVHVSPMLSVAIILAMIGAAVIASLRTRRAWASGRGQT